MIKLSFDVENRCFLTKLSTQFTRQKKRFMGSFFWLKSKLCSQQVRSCYHGRISFQLGTHWCSKRTQTLLNCTNPKLIVLMSICNSFLDSMAQIHNPWHIYLEFFFDKMTKIFLALTYGRNRIVIDVFF